MGILLSAQNLSKSFAGKTLFTKLSCGVEDGYRVGLIGPNGAGKSTLVKILVGELDPDSGTVTKRRGLRIGYLEQLPQFKKDATIWDVLQSKLDHPDDKIGEMYEWLGKLDLMQFGEYSLASALSGGWQKRLALARELITEPDVLFLDEPTNHLDIPSILWLEEFIANQNIATVTITHDRLFLQRVSNQVFDLDPRNPNGLLIVNGDYVKYLETKEILMGQQQSIEEKKKNTLRRETEWLRRGAKARQTKQKARIERAGDLKDEVQDLSQRNSVKNLKIDFGENAKQPKKLVELKNVDLKLGEQQMFQDLSFIVSPQTRLGLIGENGAGKSTLVKLIVGQLQPTAGSVQLADNLEISYFEQNKETLIKNKSLLQNICPEGDYVNFQGHFIHARSYLYKFKFQPYQLDLPVSQLSGGEQSRLRLAQMMLTKAGILVLDEPTNDLDMETLEVLEEALKEFNGAVILISHDRFFMDQVATEIMAIHNFGNGPRAIEKFADYLQWEAWFEKQKERLTSSAVTEAPLPVVTEEVSAVKRKASYKEKLEWQTLEQEIATLEGRLQSLQVRIADPEVVSNANELQALCLEAEEVEKTLTHRYERWSVLAPLFTE